MRNTLTATVVVNWRKIPISPIEPSFGEQTAQTSEMALVSRVDFVRDNAS